MSYLYIFVATIMFSFVGTLVKVATPMAPSSAVTLSRFFFGVFFLLLVCLFTKHKPKLLFTNKWIWVAVIGKCINYFCENIALQQGATFGNIVVYPSQAVTMCLLSAIFFGEKIGPRKILSTILCVSGILIISWNGNSLSGFFGDALPLTLLFVLAAVGSATFIFCQKMLIQTLPSTDMNLSVFSICALIAAFPTGMQYDDFGPFRWDSMLALIALGAITGLAFLLVAKSLKSMSLVVSGMIQNSSAIFSLLWAAIFWHEPITAYVVVGTLIFFTGLIFINLSPKKGIFQN
ncbi:MAG: DMT family transporter [Clostridia bacterium]|nr:DMT family transporter [Clostridia bacterium]